MRSRTTRAFREILDALPEHVQRQADDAYRLFRSNPSHLGLRFKRVRRDRPLYSVRVGGQYRALGYLRENGMIWIGPHDEYQRLSARL